MAFAMAALFSRSGSLKERHLVTVFAEGRKGDTEKPHAFAEAYPVEDGHRGAVDLAGIVRGGRQGDLPRKGLEIRVPHRERDFPALVAVASCPPPDPFAQAEEAGRASRPVSRCPSAR